MKGKIVVVLVDKEMMIKKPHVCFGCGQLFASRAHMRYINIADGPVSVSYTHLRAHET